MTDTPKPSAAERTGLLFNPGPERPMPDLTREIADGTVLRVVHWKTLNERPCIVRCDGGQRNIRSIAPDEKSKRAGLATLCGREIEVVDVSSTSAIPTGAKEGYCQTCLSRVGNGVLR